MTKKIALMRQGICALLLCGLWWSIRTWAVEPPGASMDITDLQMFVRVMDEIRNSYVDPVSDHELWVHAVQGMLESLDPHSQYLNSEDYQSLKEDTSGSFDGVGLELNRDDKGLVVVSPLDGSPAAKAGIQAGDRVIRLEGRQVTQQNLQEILQQMRGHSGSHLHLTLERLATQKNAPAVVHDYDLVRQSIELNTVKEQWLEPGIACLRITMFSELTGQEMQQAVERLQKKAAVQAVVLDLRNNPGGVFHSAVDVADDFLDQGVIVSTRGRLASANQQFMATPGQLLPGVPMLVLINAGTASAAEILAGALQDQHRALLLGTRSFGKGSVQSVLSLNEHQGIKLTTARYFTPSGRSIQAHGIVPDVQVQQAEVTPRVKKEIYREADLAGHLDNPQAAHSDTKETANNATTRLLETDFQMYQALLLLKAEKYLVKTH